MVFHHLVGQRVDYQRMLIILRRLKNGMSNKRKKVKIIRKR